MKTQINELREMRPGETIEAKRPENRFMMSTTKAKKDNGSNEPKSYRFVYYRLQSKDDRLFKILADKDLEKAINASGMWDNPGQTYRITRHPDILKQGKFRPEAARVYEITSTTMKQSKCQD